MKHNDRYVWLDLARGLSALMVCAGHLRGAMFVDYSNLGNITFIERAFYFTTGLGHQAVMVFFVLSGFFVGGSVLLRGDKFQFVDYFIARLSRLWVVLIPALIFTLLIDQLLAIIAPSILSGRDYSILNSGPSESGNYSQSITTFLSNIVFLQNIISPVFGTNGPLWSLSNEFWYYVLFPLLLILLSNKKMLIIRLLSLISIVVIVLLVAREMMGGFLIWLFGVAVYVFYKKNIIFLSKRWVMFFACLFLGSLADSKLAYISSATGVPNDITVGFCFSLLLISLKGKSLAIFKMPIILSSRWLSEISYTLYLFHFPAVLFIYGLFYSDQQVIFGLFSAMQFIFYLVLFLLFSYLMWFAFERNTPLVRQYLKKHIIRCSG